MNQETYRILVPKDKVLSYLESNFPAIELEDRRIITFRQWLEQYISQRVNQEIKEYIGSWR